MAERKGEIAAIQNAREIESLLQETKLMARQALTPEGQAKVKEYRTKITALTVEDLRARFNI